MAGKSSPALFELIRDPNAARPKVPISSRVDVPPGTPAGMPHGGAPAPENPVTTPYYRQSREPAWGHEPAGPAKEAPAPVEVPEPIEATPRPAGQWGQPIAIPATVLGIAAAVVVLVVVGAFATGYRAGFAKGDERATRELSLAAAPIGEPLQNVPAGRTARPGPESAKRDDPAATEPRTAVRPPAPARETAPQPVTTVPAVRAVLSPPEADPRQGGLNYYAIVGQLDRDSAQQIAAFLADNGVAALAVDTSGRGSNNSRSYRVYGLQGMTGPELRSPARQDYENRISQLGVIWKRDHRGWTDFSQTNWERYQP